MNKSVSFFNLKISFRAGQQRMYKVPETCCPWNSLEKVQSLLSMGNFSRGCWISLSVGHLHLVLFILYMRYAYFHILAKSYIFSLQIIILGTIGYRRLRCDGIQRSKRTGTYEIKRNGNVLKRTLCIYGIDLLCVNLDISFFFMYHRTVVWRECGIPAVDLSRTFVHILSFAARLHTGDRRCSCQDKSKMFSIVFLLSHSSDN